MSYRPAATTAPDAAATLSGWDLRGPAGELLKALVTPGTIYTFVRDVSFLGPFYADRKPGQHFMVTRVGPTALAIGSVNLATGRPSGLMLDQWDICSLVRVIGFAPA